ncbi:hypothetical protein INR49_003938 [Caranx melampygus]|nr:hypothetical protein INR49_003938 [Caranx melampygus]
MEGCAVIVEDECVDAGEAEDLQTGTRHEYHLSSLKEMKCTSTRKGKKRMMLNEVSNPESELVAPAIVIGPKDTTVVAGSEAILECIANARSSLSNLPLFPIRLWKTDGQPCGVMET